MAGFEKIRAVIFDYGNTLEMDPFDDILTEYGKQLTGELGNQGEDFLTQWREANKSKEEKLQWQYSSHFSQEEPFIQHALRKISVPGDAAAQLAPKILLEYRRILDIYRSQDTQQNEILKEVFSYLKGKGKIVGIISNDRSWAPEAALKTRGVMDLVDNYYTSESLGVEKPNPEIFRMVSKDMGINIDEMCYVGDDPARDIETPKKLGMLTVLYNPPVEYKKSESWRDYSAKISEKPDAVINDLREIKSLL